MGSSLGLGRYAMAMYLKLEASGGKLPDFHGLERAYEAAVVLEAVRMLRLRDS